jgi:hypothetical protein
MKKIFLLFLPLILMADIDSKGFFVGVDVSHKKSKVYYTNSNPNGLAIATDEYENIHSDTGVSFKLGYEYYFTRVYLRYNRFNYDDKEKKLYKIEGITYEINIEYIPLIYKTKNDKFNIRGIVGSGVGYNVSELEVYTEDGYLLPSDVFPCDSQRYMEYGFEIGILVESYWGISAEVGFRYRYGDLQEYTDDKGDQGNKASFDLKTEEFYFGLNYLF